MTDTPAASAPATETTAPAPAPAPTDAAALDRRDQELTALYEHDRNAYLYANQGALAREHADLRRAQQAAKEAAPQEAEQSEGDDASDAAAIDLDLPAETAEDDGSTEETASETGEPEAVEQDLDLSAYEDLPEGMELSETGEALIGIVNEHCEEHGLGPEGRNDLFDLHNRLVEAQAARFAEMDKAASKKRAAELTERLGGKEAYDDYLATARETAKLMPQSLRDAIKQARMPDGRRLSHMPELAEFLHAIASRPGQATTPGKPFSIRQVQGRTEMLRQELAELHALRDSDIDQFRRPWKATGISGSDRVLQISRELAHEGPATPSAADRNAEMRELEQLRTRDPDLFRFGSWRQTGRPPAERLHRLQTGRV